MKVKEVDRMANIAWSPENHHPIRIACGSAAQQVVDSTFNSSSSLEIYDLNLGEAGQDMSLKLSLPCDSRFEKLIWGKFGMKEEHSSGILVGGTSDGRVQIYDVERCLGSPKNIPKGAVKEHTQHSGPVFALDFNNCQSHLLASGSVQSEVFIWDLNSPNQVPMTPGVKAQPLESVTALKWNPKVQHILASAFSPRAVVWDLRKSEPIIKVSDAASRLKLKSIAWHPEVSTQLCIASEDDMHPVIQLWDLRFASSPLNTMDAHQRGVLSLSWCKQDPDLMLSCGRDNRIICWNPNTSVQGGEIVCELKGCQEWCFDVAWCPRNPAVVAASSFSGHVSVFSLLGSQTQVETPSQIADSFPDMEPMGTLTPVSPSSASLDLKTPPRWLRRPNGVSWGFGGKLVSWKIPESTNRRSVSSSSPTEEEPKRHIITVTQIVTEPDLVAKAKIILDAFKTGPSGSAAVCREKLSNLSSDQFKSLEAFSSGGNEVTKGVVWHLAEAHLSPSARNVFMSLLGVGSQEMASQLATVVGKSKRSDGGGEKLLNGSMDSSDAFDQLTLNAEKPKSYSLTEGGSKDLCLALAGGHLDAAIQISLNEKRYGEALVIAQVLGGPIVRETQEKFLKTVSGGVGKLLSALIADDWTSVVEEADVNSWRHVLCAVLTYAKQQSDVAGLCSKLGSRLEKQGKTADALVCHMIAKDLEGVSRTLDSVGRKALGIEDVPSHLQAMDYLELLLTLKQTGDSTSFAASNSVLVKILKACVEHLSSQGELELAFNIISHFPDIIDPNLEELRQRLASFSSSAQVSMHNVVQRRYSQPQNKPFSRGSFSQPSPSIAPPPTQFMTQTQQGILNPAPVPMQSSLPPSGMQPSYKPQGYDPQGFGSGMGSVQNATNPASMPPPPTTPLSKPANRGGPLQARYLADPNLYNAGYGVTPVPAPTSSVGYSSYQQQPSGNFFMPPGPTPTPPPNTFMPVNPAPPMTPGMPGSGMHPPPMTGPPPTAPPPGWNDPPSMSKRLHGSKYKLVEGTVMSAEHAGIKLLLGGRKSGKTAAKDAPAPITQPVLAPLGVDPYSQPTGMPPSSGGFGMPMQGMPMQPPPPVMMQPHHIPRAGPPMPSPAPQPMPQRQHPGMMPMQPSIQPMGGPPMTPQQHSFVPQGVGSSFQTPGSAFAPPAIDTSQHLLAVSQPSPAMSVPAPEAPVMETKPSLMPEHQAIYGVLITLMEKCSSAASHPQMRKKLEDVSKKIEVLQGKLASNALSASTVSSLKALVDAVSSGEYPKAMSYHTEIVTTGAFSEISAFMPGIKILIQVAMQLGIYVN